MNNAYFFINYCFVFPIYKNNFNLPNNFKGSVGDALILLGKYRNKKENKNEIKKRLYKEKPIAVFHEIRKDGIMYTTFFGADTVTFLVPLTEVGEVVWGREIDAQLLIRYIL
jgi:hypothetical protein